MLGDLFCILVDDVQWRPDRTRRDAVYANPFFDQIVCERFGKGVDGTLGGGVVEELFRALKPRYRAAVYDRTPFWQMLQRGAGHIKVAKDIGSKSLVELFVRNILDRFLMVLIGGVIYQNVELSKFLD